MLLFKLAFFLTFAVTAVLAALDCVELNCLIEIHSLPGGSAILPSARTDMLKHVRSYAQLSFTGREIRAFKWIRHFVATSRQRVVKSAIF